MKKEILLISSSAVSGGGYLDNFIAPITGMLEGIDELIFIPFAAGENQWDLYTEKVRERLSGTGIKVTGIHKYIAGEVVSADVFHHKALFVGGGNTFRLLYQVQKYKLINPIRDSVLNNGMKYIGSSAGSNLACKSICTTNDMPIIYPPDGFDALNLVPLQINPHYIDPDPESTHMGETREQRIKEFHEIHSTAVIGLREGAYLYIDDEYFNSGKMHLGGLYGAKFFFRGKDPVNIASYCDISVTNDDVSAYIS